MMCAMSLSNMIWDVTYDIASTITMMLCNMIYGDLWYVSYDILTINLIGVWHDTVIQSIHSNIKHGHFLCPRILRVLKFNDLMYFHQVSKISSNKSKQIKVLYPFTELSAVGRSFLWHKKLHLLLFLLGFFCCSFGLRQFQRSLFLWFFCP